VPGPAAARGMDSLATSRSSDNFGTTTISITPSHKPLAPALPPLGLPTPSSLPRSFGIAAGGIDTEMREGEDVEVVGACESASGSEGTEGEEGYVDGNGTLGMEMEMQVEGESASGGIRGTDEVFRRGSTR
jgi:hypothetical protein